LQFTISSAAPVLENIQIVSSGATQTTASFNLVINGYSTTRSLGTLNVTFTPVSGFNATAVQPIDLTGAANVWFQSTTAQSFGGLFQVTESFSLTGTAPKNQTLLDTIASVSATISNSVGTSNAVETPIQ
jgi:hypothetical protein